MSSNSRFLLLPLLAGAVALSACATTSGGGDKAAVEPTPRTPTERYALRTEERPETLLFAAYETGLSPAQRAAAIDYARHWAERGAGDIIIETASDGGAAAYTTGHAAAEVLVAEGVPAGAIHVTGYPAPADAPVRISFHTTVARVDECNRSWDRLSATGKNRPYANFGCTTKANLAAMIANPADIDNPRAMQPADAARRQVVLDKYRAGQVTSSEKDTQASDTVSRAVR